MREEFEHPSPEVEVSRRSLSFRLDEMARGKLKNNLYRNTTNESGIHDFLRRLMKNLVGQLFHST